MENDLALRLDFGAARTGAVVINILQAPSLESREAHIARAAKSGRLNRGSFSALVPRASGIRITAPVAVSVCRERIELISDRAAGPRSVLPSNRPRVYLHV